METVSKKYGVDNDPDPAVFGNDAEFDNFLSRVDEISKIMEGLSSNNVEDQEKAIRKADILLGDHGKGDPASDLLETKVTHDRTVINQANPDDLSSEGPSGDTGQAAFKRMVEKDAAERARDRIENKKKSDVFRAKGNNAFKKRAYAEALDNYNKAINLVRDSPCLYTNRALIWIRVGIPTKALDDLNLTLDLNPSSLKARLLKARALFNLSEPQLCRDWLTETKELHPQNLPMITKYEHDLFELTMELNEAFNEDEVGKQNRSKEKMEQHPHTFDMDAMKARLHEITSPEMTWLKAARGQIGIEEKEDGHALNLD